MTISLSCARRDIYGARVRFREHYPVTRPGGAGCDGSVVMDRTIVIHLQNTAVGKRLRPAISHTIEPAGSLTRRGHLIAAGARIHDQTVALTQQSHPRSARRKLTYRLNGVALA